MNKRKTPVLISISHAVRLAQTNRPRFMRYLAHANITPYLRPGKCWGNRLVDRGV
jgi:hypothetical protein